MLQTSVYCPTCEQHRLFTAPDMNHVAHILASIFLCGLWLPVWIGTAMLYNPVYRCQTCGFGMTPNEIRASRQGVSNSPESDHVFAEQQFDQRTEQEFDQEETFWTKPRFGTKKKEPPRVKINRHDMTKNISDE